MPRQEMVLHSIGGSRLTLQCLAAAADMAPEQVEQFVAYGLVEPATDDEQSWFDAAAISRVCKIRRLRNDLGINLPGIAVALDLLERIEMLQREIRVLRRRLQ